MKPLDKYNPAVVFIYFMLTAGFAMFINHPLITAFSLIGSVFLFFVRNYGVKTHGHVFWLIMFVIMSLINPLTHHNGKTVLFVLNDNPVTLEALFYGIVTSGMIVSVTYWFRSFSQLMTSDRLLYIFGSISPKFALIFSMALRYIPLFGKQINKVNSAQKALGLYNTDSIPAKIRSSSRVFSIMVTWALENGIITADSMSARGYGVTRRSHFALYRFTKADALFLVTIICLSASTFVCGALGSLQFNYYPSLSQSALSFAKIAAYIAYFILCLLPTLIEIGDKIKWHYLKSGI